jgi:mannose-1-phosphate guanylyltransferase
MASPLWAIVVSENHGLRPGGLIGGVPKPMWSVDGRSLLEDTLDRVSGLVPGARTVTVIGPTQSAAAAALRERVDPGHVVRQPGDRGTAPGVLLGLATVLDVRPDAVVLLTPADHGIRDVDQFRLSVRDAAGAVRDGHAAAILFGVRPVRGGGASNWVTPVRTSTSAGGARALRPVIGLVERPAPDDLRELVRADSLWNTNVLVGSAQALFDAYCEHLRYMVDMVGRVWAVKGPARARRVEEEYRALRPAEFSRDLLSRMDALAVYTWPASVGWSPIASPGGFEAWHKHADTPKPATAVLGWSPPGVRRAFGS